MLEEDVSLLPSGMYRKLIGASSRDLGLSSGSGLERWKPGTSNA